MAVTANAEEIPMYSENHLIASILFAIGGFIIWRTGVALANYLDERALRKLEAKWNAKNNRRETNV
jgi:hypothetical protein|tara:strand:- start:299 stop:496 length:198 start_codon:yes stop_codon:yes gene_type:complete